MMNKKQILYSSVGTAVLLTSLLLIVGAANSSAPVSTEQVRDEARENERSRLLRQDLDQIVTREREKPLLQLQEDLQKIILL